MIHGMKNILIWFAGSMLVATAVAACVFDDALAPAPTGAKPQAAAGAGGDWRKAEQGILADHVQLTFGDRFIKAGEAYFSPDDKKIIFQAVEVPPAGQQADEFYAMFVADVKREGASADSKITGIENIKRISPVGSANTCGWFHPIEPNVAIFASTIVPPKAQEGPGFRGGADSKYLWAFPKETRIVRCDLTKADGTAKTLQDVGGYAGEYQAEGSLSADGRHLLYCSLESNEGDLFVLDLKTKAKNRIVQAKGYDGGPFFSPDGKRICYRSDRNNDNLLQLFVADLVFNEQGEIVGIEREYQLTDNQCVNWCPYWLGNRRLVYSSSALGESNFEIFMIDADSGNVKGSNGTIKYGTGVRRITHFEEGGGVAGSDVLPVMSQDGKWMTWASRRGPDGDVQLWTARFVLDPDKPWKTHEAESGGAPKRAGENRVTIEDPDSGRIFLYDLKTHELSEYDPRSHKLTVVKDQADIARFMELYKQQEQEKAAE
jgi:TolB protein